MRKREGEERISYSPVGAHADAGEERGRNFSPPYSCMDAQVRKERRRKWRSLSACGSEEERQRCRGGEEKKEEEGEREQRKGIEEMRGERERERERAILEERESDWERQK